LFLNRFRSSSLRHVGRVSGVGFDSKHQNSKLGESIGFGLNEQLNRDKAASTSSGSKKEPRNIGDKMVNSRMKIVFFLVLLGYLLSACAQLKEAGRRIGHTTRDVARDIGHGTRDAAKTVGEGVKKVVRSATEDEQ